MDWLVNICTKKKIPKSPTPKPKSPKNPQIPNFGFFWIQMFAGWIQINRLKDIFLKHKLFGSFRTKKQDRNKIESSSKEIKNFRPVVSIQTKIKTTKNYIKKKSLTITFLCHDSIVTYKCKQ
jgi:hypothetical protein